MQHNFAPNGQSNPTGTSPIYDQLRNYSDIFPQMPLWKYLKIGWVKNFGLNPARTKGLLMALC